MSGGGDGGADAAAATGSTSTSSGTGRFSGLSADRDRGDQRDNGGRYGDRGGRGGYRRDDREGRGGGAGSGDYNKRGNYDRPRVGRGDADNESPSDGPRRGGGGGGGGDRGGGGGGFGDNWRGRGGAGGGSGGGGPDRFPTTNDGRARPRLNLKTRGGAATESANTDGPKPEEGIPIKDDVAGEGELKTTEPQATPTREPLVVNSRAEAMGGGGGAPDSGRGQGRRESPRHNSNDGPPPVRNARFERMAEEEREKLRLRREERGPPPVANSRFAAAAEADRSSSNDDRGGGSSSYNNDDRGPPMVANSRFAAAAEADRSSRSSDHNNDRGPPPIANSRFAAAAQADGGRGNYDRDRDRDRGPPPVANSRFAAAAEADRSPSYSNDRERGSSSYQNDRDRGPPPVANSRFAAAAEADRDYTKSDRFDDRSPRDDRPRYNDNNRDRSRFSDDRGPPPVTNSRFASAAALSKEDDRVHEERRAERYGSRDRFDGARSRFDPRYVEEPEPEVDNSRMDELIQRTLKKKEQEIVLEPKAKEHEANMFQVPAKALVKEEDDFLSYRKKVKEERLADGPTKEEKADEGKVSISEVSADTTEEVMRAFVNGGLLGNDLKAWCDEKRLMLPTVEKLLKYFLVEHEKLNPDPDCAWAERDQYGAALVSIVDDDLFKQMQVLWAIQEYCDGLGFPSHNNENVVQSMFRSMYKYDLAEVQAFEAWKEDESETHEKGKMTTVMQTVDWFNWLEEDDDEEDEED